MDILAHTLWAVAAGKVANKGKRKKKLNLWLTGFFGVFPDIFAFGIPIIWLIFSLLFGSLTLADMPDPHDLEPMPSEQRFPIFQMTNMLYNFSHSIIVFLLVFAVLFLIFRRPIWELSGWLIHILIDIPTHTYQFYPTPFLWPVSGWMFDGISWGNIWFMLINYTALSVVFFILLRNKKKHIKSKAD